MGSCENVCEFFLFTQSAVESDGAQVIYCSILCCTVCILFVVKEYLDSMTDEEQLAMALQMSMQSDAQAMETDDVDTVEQPGTSQEGNSESQENAEFEELAENREFLQVFFKSFC